MTPPNVIFEDPIPFHPNVYPNGNICVDSLQTNWTPTISLDNLIMTLFALLIDPNPNSPVNEYAGKLIKECQNKYEQQCLASMKKGSRIREKEK